MSEDRYIPFSEREGIIPEKVLQLDSMDDILRNSLWNVMYRFIFDNSVVSYVDTFGDIMPGQPYHKFAIKIWDSFFKFPLDELRSSQHLFIRKIKANFLGCLWHRAYDFVEFVARNNQFKDEKSFENFINQCNLVLEKEKSGFRFVGKSLSRITNSTEMEEVKQAMKTPLNSVNTHIKTALLHLSDKTDPDYRNSIKESISSVESLCKKIASKDDATLTTALNEIQNKGIIQIHEDMKESFQKLYGYTSDASGIRHGLMDGKIEPDFDDAKFMLVSCSAFVNYLISKANKARINLN